MAEPTDNGMNDTARAVQRVRMRPHIRIKSGLTMYMTYWRSRMARSSPGRSSLTTSGPSTCRIPKTASTSVAWPMMRPQADSMSRSNMPMRGNARNQRVPGRDVPRRHNPAGNLVRHQFHILALAAPLTWTTMRPATTQVEYGTTASLWQQHHAQYGAGHQPQRSSAA